MSRQPREAREVAITAVLIGVLGWAVGPLLVRGMSVSGTTVSFYRMWSAVPVMILLARLLGEKLTRSTLKLCVAPGLLFGLSMMLSFEAMRTTSIANATLIGQLTPALMILGAGRLVGEKPTGRAVVAALVSFAGLGLMVASSGDTSGSSLGGDLFAVANVLSFTGYFLLMKKLRNANVGSWEFLAGVFLVGAIALTPYCLLAADDLGDISRLDLVRVGVMIIGPGVLGHGLITWATRHLDVTTTSLLTLLSPPLSVIGAWFIFDQKLSVGQFVGGAVVLLGLAGTVAAARYPKVVEPV